MVIVGAEGQGRVACLVQALKLNIARGYSGLALR